MELILAFLAGCIVAAAVCYLIFHHLSQKTAQHYEANKSLLQSQVQADYVAQLARMESERDNALHQNEQLKQDFEARLAEREQTHTEAFAAQEQRFRETTDKLMLQMQTNTQEMLRQRQDELGKANSESVGQLLNPLRQELQNVQQLMKDTRSANEKSTSSLEGALREMQKQTMQIGQDANNLADALKNRGKVHGDWGEQVLADILAGSGLREGTEYVCQQSFKGAQGNELRPDVVVNCADGKRVIIDSKVSLTAYADALGAENNIDRDSAVKRNYESVKKHVRELADKQYPKYVEGAMNYVLMFIPNEGAYVMAMNYNHALSQEAFRNGVIIVNPTNLMLTLYLVLQTWQNTRQEDNCKQILEMANSLYDKVIGLTDTCLKLGNQLDTARNTYRTAMGQLSEGNGNVLKRIENLKEYGVTGTRKLKSRKSTSTDLPAPTDSTLPIE